PVVTDVGGHREPQAPNLGPQASRAARLQAAGLAGGQGPRTPDGHHAGVTARQAVEPDHRSGLESSLRDRLPDFDRRRARQTADRANPKAQAAVERLKELNQLDAKNQIRYGARGDAVYETSASCDGGDIN